MFKHLLVPIDLSQRNARALRTALDLARLSGASVTLFHVVYRIAEIPFDELRGFYRRLLRMSERKLSREARGFAKKGVAVSTEVVIGEPAVEIARAAAKHKADLIVIGSHRVNPTRRAAGWGTVSYKVGILCQCPILLVK